MKQAPVRGNICSKKVLRNGANNLYARNFLNLGSDVEIPQKMKNYSKDWFWWCEIVELAMWCFLTIKGFIWDSYRKASSSQHLTTVKVRMIYWCSLQSSCMAKRFFEPPEEEALLIYACPYFCQSIRVFVTCYS